jgi:hypothetical protein
LRLYVETMDAVVVGVSADGRVQFEGEEWRVPTLQETRAIIHAATEAVEDLHEWIETLTGSRQ